MRRGLPSSHRPGRPWTTTTRWHTALIRSGARTSRPRDPRARRRQASPSPGGARARRRCLTALCDALQSESVDTEGGQRDEASLWSVRSWLNPAERIRMIDACVRRARGGLYSTAASSCPLAPRLVCSRLPLLLLPSPSLRG
jgi:hypothetical protein